MKTWECSECGMRVQIDIDDEPKYCPNCKAIDKFSEIQLSNMDRPLKFDGYGAKK